MGTDEKVYFEQKIEELERRLSEKDRRIRHYEDEIADLNQHLQGLIQQISHELKTAHSIQKILVPTEFPTIPGFEFSTKFVASMVSGGDYFDIFELQDKFSFGIILASSSGHATSALLLSILLKLTGRIEARKGLPPGKVMKLLADELAPNVEGDGHASVFCASIDRRSLKMSYSATGMVGGYWVPNSEEGVVTLKSLREPISKKNPEKYGTEKIALNPKDRLVFVSQGVLQVQNKKGESFPEQKIIDLLQSGRNKSPHEMRNEVLFQVQSHCDLEELPRDLTVLVIDIKERVLKLAKG